MKKRLFFSKIIVVKVVVLVLIAFGIFASDAVSAQSQYRQPSKSDIEWLLGNNNKSKLPNRKTINIDENFEDDTNTITPAVFRNHSKLPAPCKAISCSKNGSKLKNPICQCEYCGEQRGIEPCSRVITQPQPNPNPNPNPNPRLNPNPQPQKIQQIDFPTTAQQLTDGNNDNVDDVDYVANRDASNVDAEQQTQPIVALNSGFPAKSNAVNSTLNSKTSKQTTIEFAAQKPIPIETDAAQNPDTIKVHIAYPVSEPIHLTTPQPNKIAATTRHEKQHTIQPITQHAKQKSLKNKTNTNTADDCNCGNVYEGNHDLSCQQNAYRQNDRIDFSCKKNIYDNDCLCDSCSQNVGCDSGEIIAETCVGILFRQINRLRHARLKHSASHNGQCNCWLCANLDNPDMTGNGIWNRHRVVEFGDIGTGISGLQLSPNMFLSRPDIATHFNAESRNRIWADYRQFNNAAVNAIILRNGNVLLRDRSINLFTFGIEKRIGGQTSFEVRVPLLYQFDSASEFAWGWRNLQRAGSSELGNITLVTKYVFARTKKFTMAAGLGVSLPTADDWTVTNFDAAIENNAYNIVSYLAAQWHPDDSTFGHVLFQADIPANKNEIHFDNRKIKIEESQLLQIGIQLGRWFYRNESGMYSLRIGGFVEVDYAVAVNSADNVYIVNNNNSHFIGVNSTDKRPDALNFTTGLPIAFGQLTVNNAVIVPLSNNRQFSIAYNFSLCRKF